MDTYQVLCDAFRRIGEEVDRATDALGPEGLAFRPDDQANSIGWLVWHLTRVQDDHVSELAGLEQAYTTDGWAALLGRPADPHDNGWGHTSEQVAAVRFADADPLVAYHHAVEERTIGYLVGVDGAELDRIIDTRWDPPVTVGVRLVSVISDCLQHAGQANYIRGLWERRG